MKIDEQLAANSKLLASLSEKSATSAQIHQVIQGASKNFEAYTSGFEPDEDHVQKMTKDVQKIQKLAQKGSKQDQQALKKLEHKMGMY